MEEEGPTGSGKATMRAAMTSHSARGEAAVRGPWVSVDMACHGACGLGVPSPRPTAQSIGDYVLVGCASGRERWPATRWRRTLS